MAEAAPISLMMASIQRADSVKTSTETGAGLRTTAPTAAASGKVTLDSTRALAAEAPTMILCAEIARTRCHRRHLAEALEARGWHVADHGRTLAERTARGEMRLVRKTG